MSNQEFASSRLELGIRYSAQSLRERSIGSGRIRMRRRTGIIERGKDSRRSFLLDEIADDLIIEVIDRGPLRIALRVNRARMGRTRMTDLDLFSYVFLLLGFESELNEDLLQFLCETEEISNGESNESRGRTVDVVDTELFELIGLRKSSTRNPTRSTKD